MQNKELYESLKKLCQQTLTLMKDRKGKCGNVAIERIMRYVIDSPQSASFEYSFFSEFEKLFFLKVYPDSTLTPYIEEVVKQMTADQEIAKHLPDQNAEEPKIVWFLGFCVCLVREWDIIQNFLMNFVNASCARSDLNWGDKIFDEYYQYFEDEFYGNHVEIRVVAPLINFGMDSEEINVMDGLKIVKQTSQDRIEIFAPPDKRSLLKSLSLDFAIEKTFQVQKSVNGDAETDLNLYEDAAEVQTALRLFKSEKAGFDVVKITTRNPSVLHPTIHLRAGLSTCNFSGNKYTLNDAEKGDFVKFLNLYREVKTSPSSNGVFANNVMVAIKRFTYAYERLSIEDKLIDSVIGFEALFLKNDEREDMRYRLSLRTACFLENEKDKRVETFDFIHDAYGKRSKIVHGGRRKSEELSTDFIARVENYLRSSIKKILVESLYKKSHKDFIKELDYHILGCDVHARPKNSHARES